MKDVRAHAAVQSTQGRASCLACERDCHQDRPVRILFDDLFCISRVQDAVRVVYLQFEQGNTLSHFAFNLRHSEQLLFPFPVAAAAALLAAAFSFLVAVLILGFSSLTVTFPSSCLCPDGGLSSWWCSFSSIM